MGKSRAKDGGARAGSVQESARAFLRAAVGGLLVGLPLLWTMEMWELGSTMQPLKLLLLLALAFGIVVGFNTVSGFRRERTWRQLLVDSLEGMGIAVVIAAGMLFLLGRLEPEHGLQTLVGRVALLSIPVAFGTAIAAAVLNETDAAGGREPTGPIGRLLVSAGGALYFALNVAPTDEVRILGSEADVAQLLVVIAASIVLSLGIVFLVELPGAPHMTTMRAFIDAPIDNPIGETIAAYVVALLISAVLIVALGLSDGLGLRAMIGFVVMLGTIATFGSAAGRLLIGGVSGGSGRGGT